MARRCVKNHRKAGVWTVLVILVLLMAAGCPEPPKQPEPPKPPEKPLVYRMLTSGDQKETLDYVRSFLDNMEIEFDPTWEVREGLDNILPDYRHTINVLFLPQDKNGEAFLRAAADAVGITLSEAQRIAGGEKERAELLRFVRNTFLLRELAVYLRVQYKIFNYVNPFEEEEVAQGFAHAMIGSFVAAEPELKPLPEKLTGFYEKLLARAPKDFPGFSQDTSSLKEWFNKNHAELASTNQSSYLLYKMLRQLAHFKEEQAVAFTGFVKEHFLDKSSRALGNINLADKSLSAYTIYDGRKRALKRIAHSYQFRGLSGVAVGLDGRVFFSDYRNIVQVKDRGGRDVVEGSQGVFAPTGFCTDAHGRFFFVGRDMVRAANLPGRSVANIKLAGKLEESAATNPHGIAPIAVTPEGNVLVANNSKRSHTLYVLDGEGSIVNSAALRGVAGGIAYHNGNIYVTNTSHHTVDSVDFSGGVATVAGFRDFPGHGDGKGYDVFFNSPTGICVNEDGVVFVADTYNHAIRRIETDGTVSTVVGIARGRADGPAGTARLHCPVGISVGKDGTLYVAELASKRVVAVSPARPSPESKRIPATGISDLDSPDKETAELSGTIERSAIGYKLFDTYLKRGIRYRELGEYDKSSADLEATTKIAPDKLSAYVEAGLTKEAADRMDDAIEIYSLAINMKEDLVPAEQFRDHDFMHALMQRGLAQASQGSFTSALEDLTKVIDTRKMAVKIFKEPDLPPDKVARIWFTRGKIYHDSGDFKKAIADFNEALIHDTKLVKAYYYRGLAYKGDKKYESAVKDLRKAASLESTYAEPHYVLGQIYQSDLVDLQKAIQHLRTYLALGGPNKTDAQARIEELEQKMDRTSTPEEAFWEEVIEDSEGKRWILRHYASGKTQKFPVKEEKEK